LDTWVVDLIGNNMGYKEELEELRNVIDITDDVILNSVIMRIDLAMEIGVLKKEHGITEMSQDRRKEILDRVIKKSEEQSTPTYLTKKIFEVLIDHSVELQQMILKSKG
jgi:chorismate mutase